MKTYGDPQTQTLVSVDTDDEGNPTALDAALVPLVKTPAPPLTATQKAQPVLVWFDDRVERQWEIVTAPVPDAVPFRSLAFALLEAGLYEQVKAAAMSTPAGEIWWSTAQGTTVSRGHPFVAALALAVGQTPEQIDAIFAAAALQA